EIVLKVSPYQPALPPVNTSPTAASTSSGRLKAPTDTQARSTAPSVSIHLSANANASGHSEVDMQRVLEIRQAIQQGKLQVNVDRIADGLLETALELIKGKP